MQVGTSPMKPASHGGARRWCEPDIDRRHAVYAHAQEASWKEFIPTPLAFDRLLQWLDDGVDSGGERYLEMRRRLVSYFDRRQRRAADELADETLSRIARTLQEEGVIETTPPARYCYVMARLVFLEDVRRQRRELRLHSEAAVAARAARLVEWDGRLATREERLEDLERCLEKLPLEQRELVVEYYRDAQRQGIDHRRRMAERLGITRNALGIRAFRIREALMTCVKSDTDCARTR
jgi:DNA-directed RNA polymerase specialized sigma24 family protein